MHDTCNMVDMKCRLHNQAYVNLVHKGYTLPKQIVIDQFVQEKSYYRYLQGFPEVIRGITFETKAENKYPGSSLCEYSGKKCLSRNVGSYGRKI